MHIELNLYSDFAFLIERYYLHTIFVTQNPFRLKIDNNSYVFGKPYYLDDLNLWR